MTVRTSSSAWVHGIVEMFKAEGVDVATLFREVGLDLAALEDPVRRFSIDDVSALWEAAVARSGKVNLGLSTELARSHGNLGVVRYAMMACPTLRDALQRLARSMDVVSNAATFALTETTEGLWFELGHLGGDRPVPRQRVEFGMLAILCFCSWIAGRELHPQVVEFVHPEPADARRHRDVFACPVRFGARANRALLRACDLDLPLSARDSAMAELHARLVDDELQRLDVAPTSQRVRQALAARLAHGEPRRQDVAVALHVSDRTLQRRLRAEGTSFRQLLDETRRALAEQYLRRPHDPLCRIADLLGFEDQSNFFRACKRWFGASPRRYRARMAEVAAVATVDVQREVARVTAAS